MLHARSGGNPLFALALAGDGGGRIPSSIQEAIAATADRLDPAVTAVIRAGAVLDATLDVDLLAGVLQVPAIVVIERLERASSTDLLIESGPGFEFRHPLIREALAAPVGAARSAFLHREAARILADRPGHDPLAVAVHARLGGLTTIAAQAFQAAAAVSFARSDLAVAEEQLRASLHAVETGDAHRTLARLLIVAGRLDEAAVEAERAVTLGGGPDSLEVAGWIEYYRRRYERARRFADEAVERADPASPVRASALALGGRVRHGAGDISGAEERLGGALAGPAGVRGVAEVWLGHLRVHEGRPTDALGVDRARLDRPRSSRPSVRCVARSLRPGTRPRPARPRRRGAARLRRTARRNSTELERWAPGSRRPSSTPVPGSCVESAGSPRRRS